MRSFALLAVGPDQPGIIAAIAEPLVVHGLNVTDSQMGILRGFFAMTLLLEAGDAVDATALSGDLRAAGERFGLESLTLRELPGSAGVGGELDSATHVVSVYGADHPGILASVTASLAAAGVNVCDLRTRLLEADAVYVMVVDVAVPEAVDLDAVRAALEAVGEREGVDVTLRAADADTL